MELPHVEHLGAIRSRIGRGRGIRFRFICATGGLGGNTKCANHDTRVQGGEMLPRWPRSATRA